MSLTCVCGNTIMPIGNIPQECGKESFALHSWMLGLGECILAIASSRPYLLYGIFIEAQLVNCSVSSISVLFLSN